MLPIYSPSDFVAVFNQVLENSFPSLTIEGELSNFKISKNRWVYFDLKDETASVRFFGNIYNLPGPLQDGMMLRVQGTPRMHPQFNFSVNVQSITLSGDGTIKKAFELLKQKLTKEGLFDTSRKRILPYPPETIGLITSGESAAYADFVKIIKARWGGLAIQHADVQVKGDSAPFQLVSAIEWFNRQAELPDILVIIRGGGSADDMQAFNTEQVVRAISAGRIPTMVAIGHEVDFCLAELAADVRASTPSNAAELVVPDKTAMARQLNETKQVLTHRLLRTLTDKQHSIVILKQTIEDNINALLTSHRQKLANIRQILELINPEATLKRGYAIVRYNGKTLKSGGVLKTGETVDIRLYDAQFDAIVGNIKRNTS